MEVTGDLSGNSIDGFFGHFDSSARAKEFARRLVSGAVRHKGEIDPLIEEAAENWKLVRMPKVDLNILRLAAYELMFCPDIPMNVSIDEAIEIGKRYGSEESPNFINGVLDQLASQHGLRRA